MSSPEKRRFWYNPQLDINSLQAFYVKYAYPRHSHDQYVICLIERGVQSFLHRGTKYITPPSGLIMINPGVIHTGEPATEQGFLLRSLYPTVASLQAVAAELSDRSNRIPYFKEVRVDDPVMTQAFIALHDALKGEDNPLAAEAQYLTTMAELIRRYADLQPAERPLGHERRAVRQAREYLESHFDQSISLTDLADHVALSPYYFLRVFRREVGLPPHAFLQDVRIRRAQQLIEQGRPLAEVAQSTGFSSQSHLTRRFKRVVGVTPGRYATQINAS
ncbi:MAG: AraC family transcriptional regulator [Ardenticatenaceae bacterium]|nr:AraC family transcriptional regulator [Ardenticatenaceae bacterium]